MLCYIIIYLNEKYPDSEEKTVYVQPYCFVLMRNFLMCLFLKHCKGKEVYIWFILGF